MNIEIDNDAYDTSAAFEAHFSVYQTLKDDDVLHPEFVERDIAVYGPCYNQLIVCIEADYDLVVIAAARILAERALGFRSDYAPPRRCRFEATGDKVFAADTPVYMSFIPEAVELTAVMIAVSAEMCDDPDEYDEDWE